MHQSQHRVSHLLCRTIQNTYYHVPHPPSQTVVDPEEALPTFGTAAPQSTPTLLHSGAEPMIWTDLISANALWTCYCQLHVGLSKQDVAFILHKVLIQFRNLLNICWTGHP